LGKIPRSTSSTTCAKKRNRLTYERDVAIGRPEADAAITEAERILHGPREDDCPPAAGTESGRIEAGVIPVRRAEKRAAPGARRRPNLEEVVDDERRRDATLVATAATILPG